MSPKLKTLRYKGLTNLFVYVIWPGWAKAARWRQRHEAITSGHLTCLDFQHLRAVSENRLSGWTSCSWTCLSWFENMGQGAMHISPMQQCAESPLNPFSRLAL